MDGRESSSSAVLEESEWAAICGVTYIARRVPGVITSTGRLAPTFTGSPNGAGGSRDVQEEGSCAAT